MKFSPRIMSDRNILDRYQDTFNRIVEWYQEVYQNNSKSLTEEYINVMTEMILLPDSTLYNDINAKQSLFQIAEILEKILLAKYSYSPKDCKSISSSVEKTWLDVSWDFIMLTDTLQTELMREKEGANIALRVLLYERGQVRNPIVHRGSKAICLSAVRCYNVIRSMLIFIEPSLRSSLQEYRYPEEEDCVQSLFSHTGNFGFKIKTSILFVDTLRDMPLEYRELISRLPWNLVVDLDGYSDFEGAAASFSGNGNIQRLTNSTLSSLRIQKDFTSWLICGDMVNLCYHDKYNKELLNMMPAKKPLLRQDEHANPDYGAEWGKWLDIILREVAAKQKSVMILYLCGDKELAVQILKKCKIHLANLEYTFDGIFNLSPDVQRQIESEVYSTEMAYNDLSYKDNYIFSCVSIESFLDRLYQFKDQLPVNCITLPDKSLPSANGHEDVADWAINLEQYFDVLYLAEMRLEDHEQQDVISRYYKGEEMSWPVFYQDATVELIQTRDFIKHINHIKTILGRIPNDPANKIVYISHQPGIGGSTLLRQIGWELHKDYPVLRLKHYDHQNVSSLIRSLYDRLGKSIVILADEEIKNYDGIIQDIKNLPRACVLILATRKNTVSIASKSHCIELHRIDDFVTSNLADLYYKHSPLDDGTKLEKKKEFAAFISGYESMNTPFMIALYYFDAEFKGLQPYVEKVFAELNVLQKSEREQVIWVLMFIALCHVYGNTFLPSSFINNYLNLNLGKTIFLKYRSLESIIYLDETDYLEYKPKHFLISQMILKMGCGLVYPSDNYKDYLKDIAEKFINAAFQNKDFILYNNIILKCIFTVQAESSLFEPVEDNNHQKTGFSLLINDIQMPESRKKVLRLLATNAEHFLKKMDSDDEAVQDIRLMVSHFYGHLARLCSKRSMNIENYSETEKYSDLSIQYMQKSGKHDRFIYHMHAEAMRLVLKNELQHAEDEEQDCDYSKFEKRIDAIMKFYSLSAQYGSPDRAWVSELILLVEYLGFIYKKKKRLADKAYPDLSEKQNYYRMTIHRLINMISQLDLDESTQNLANRYISRFKVELMSNGYKDARTYYENKIASLRNNSGSETELITAQNGLLSVYFGIYEEEKNAKLISVILGLISDMLEVNHNEDEYFECCNRCALYQKWMKFAKLANKPVDDGIIIADRWRQLVEKNTFNIDIRPYYYLYVLYFLSALEGNSLRMNDANKYRKICGEKWISKLGAIDRIRDFFVIGKGMGQLHEAGSYQNHADVLQNRQVKLATFSGRFDDITSKKGHIHITEPGEWNRIIAKFNLNNTLGITNNQLSHQLSFLGGFSYETIVALDKTVKDMSIQASKSSSTAAPQFRQFEVNFKVDRFSDIDGYVLEGSFLDKSGNEKLAILKAEQIERYSVKEIAVYGDIKDIFLSLEKRTKEIKAMTIGHSHGYIELSVIDFYEHLCDLMEVE